MKEQLTPEQQKALVIIAENGCIERYPGGFWGKPNDELKGFIPKEMGGRMSKDCHYPENSVGTLTIKALEKRGLIKPTEYKRGHSGPFPIKYTLV